MQSITRHHILHFACGCTTTRIEVELAKPEPRTVCAGHLAGVIREEHITEYINGNAEDEKQKQQAVWSK